MPTTAGWTLALIVLVANEWFWNKSVRTDLLEAAGGEDVCALLRDPDRAQPGI